MLGYLHCSLRERLNLSLTRNARQLTGFPALARRNAVPDWSKVLSAHAIRGHVALAGYSAALSALISAQMGAAIAKGLFPLVGTLGMSGLRTSIAAVLLAIIIRPWHRPIRREWWTPLLGYGTCLGFMNIFIYQAFERIPIGIAAGIEVLGPLCVVAFSSRGAKEFVWVGLALLGMMLLIPRGGQTLDIIGVIFAIGAGAAWAGYLLFGAKVAPVLGRDAVVWGMVIASFITAPAGLASAGSALLDFHVLFLGLCVALMASALPFTLEMFAMRNVRSKVFGMIQSTSPAIGALAGFLVLGESLTVTQWIAILLVVTALFGSVSKAARLESHASKSRS